ncbi:MAG: hypothetical protein BWK77_00800 [Verrucomicrobia bacterium A1]|nr:MAG: hypothetical protein BWK77_00800 [Verrucomicrobia bacterium A1]
MADWLGEVRDPRQSGRAAYPMKALLLLGVLMFLSHTGSRNHFNDNLRDALEMAKTLARLLGCALEALPHLDTLEKVLRSFQPDTLETLLAQLIRRLIRMKALDDWRVGGRFLLAIDGTGLYAFPRRHCEHCIETRHDSGAVTYSHKVLVAFIVSENGYALPIGCEFIENPGAVYDKQDCETKAFHRLEPKIKRFFPQTSFGLLLDALYADQNVMRGCLGNGWDFAITFKESDMPALWAEAQSLLALCPGQCSTMTLPQGEGTRQIHWVNDLDYQGMKLSAIFQVDRDSEGHIVGPFAHLTARPIDPSHAWKVATAARLRWRCENEGFNVLKNGGFALEHVYSHNPVASKGYFLLMLIAHIVQQLLARGRLGTVFKAAFHTFLHYGKQMLEALKNQPLPPDLNPPGQIRLSTA